MVPSGGVREEASLVESISIGSVASNGGGVIEDDISPMSGEGVGEG